MPQDLLDPGIQAIASLLGNIMNAYIPSYYSYGVTGLTTYVPTAGRHGRVGAFATSTENFYNVTEFVSESDINTALYFGSYLVRTSEVPEPNIALLIGSGLLGLSVLSRRRT